MAQINNKPDKTLYVVFSRLKGFSFTENLWQRPIDVTHMLSLCLVIQRCLLGTPLGFCLRVIVNKKPLNLEKTISSVISVSCFKNPRIYNKTNFLNKSFYQDFVVNKSMKEYLLEANINPYSSEGRSDIYCRFVLDYPEKKIEVK